MKRISMVVCMLILRSHLKRIFLLLCTIVIIAAGVTGQIVAAQESQQAKAPDPQSWQRYTVKGEEFSVTLPTVPAMLTVKVSLPVIQKKRKERRLTTAADGVIYTINVFENVKPVQPLDAFITEQSKSVRSELTFERDVNIDGISGKEYCSRNNTPVTTVQFFATEKRLYSFAATGSPADNAAVKQFFSSIALGKKQEGAKVEDGPGVPLVFERIYTGKEVDTKARLTSRPEPSYTEEARQYDVTGIVVLKVVFASNGQVTNIRVASGLPHGLTERAIAAARKIKFIPATKDGRYVSMWMQLEYNFNLY